jgi:hypothetical protein
MAENTRYCKVDRALSRISFLANFFGALFMFLYFEFIENDTQAATAGEVQQFVLAAAGTMAALILLGSYLSDRFLRPMMDHKVACQQAGPGPAPERVRWLALRALGCGDASQDVVSRPGLWLAGSLGLGKEAERRAFLAVLGTLVAGVLVAILMYMATENIWRHELPLFFSGQTWHRPKAGGQCRAYNAVSR